MTSLSQSRPLRTGTSRVQAPAPPRMPSGPEAGTVDRKSSALLTYQDVADRCRCSPWTVRDWVDAGRIPVVRLPGRLVRVREEDLERFLEAHRG